MTGRQQHALWINLMPVHDTKLSYAQSCTFPSFQNVSHTFKTVLSIWTLQLRWDVVICHISLLVGHEITNGFWFYGLDNTHNQFHKVYWRLIRAEQRGEELSYKLIQMLEKLKNLNNTAVNLTIANSLRNSSVNSWSNSSGKWTHVWSLRRTRYPLSLSLSLTHALPSS